MSGRGGGNRPKPRGRPAGPARGGRHPVSPGGALGGEQVEGRRAVRELLVVGRRRARDVWISEAAGPSALLDEIAALAAERAVPVRRVARDRLDAAARTDAAQGVVARADPLPEADLDDLARPPAGDRPPFLVVLESVTDPHNLGAVLRSAACAGATGALLARHRAVHVTPTVAKAAAGAVEHLPLAVAPGIPSALARLHDAGVWVVGLAGDGPVSVFDLPLATEAVALVLGSEGAGLSRLARARCDVVAAIPRYGGPASLNVAAAAAVACYEVARRREGGRRGAGP